MMPNDETSEQEQVVLPPADAPTSLDSAFEIVVREHWQRLYGKAFKHLRHEEDAKETVQEALLKAYKALQPRPFETITSLERYIYITLKTCIIDRAKANQIDNQHRVYIPMLTNTDDEQPLLEIEAPPDNQPEHVVDLIESDERAMQRIEQLSPTLRVVAFLSFIMDYTGPEIAEKLGIGLEAAKSRVTRSRNLLLQKFNASEEI